MGAAIGEMRELLDRWVDEGQRLIGILLAFLEQWDRVQNQADTAERACERLQDEVRRLQLETESYRREREEIAESFARVMGEVLARLHPEANPEAAMAKPAAERTRIQPHPVPLN